MIQTLQLFFASELYCFDNSKHEDLLPNKNIWAMFAQLEKIFLHHKVCFRCNSSCYLSSNANISRTTGNAKEV